MTTDRPDQPGPLRRRGPRPLWLHLMRAPTSSAGCASGWPIWKDAWPPWNSADGAPGPDPALVAGIAAYRRHPYQRNLPDPPVLWAEGNSRLLDYGPPGGLPLLFVPSLVNRAYVLDLAEDCSLMRYLSAAGMRPLLLDWGWPGSLERRFTLTDYIAGRLERAMAAVKTPAVLAGYCMGGLLALAAALRRPDAVRGLLLLATPWDFHAGLSASLRAALPRLWPAWAAAAAPGGAVPVDVLQLAFALADPGGVGRKYRRFRLLDPASREARLFVALEDWLNDGVPLAAPAAAACVNGWYVNNEPRRGTWPVAGLPVRPEALRLPCLVVAPGRDRIVPPASAEPLAALIPGARLLQPAAGHIGMIVGSRAKDQLWRPLLDWLGGFPSPA